MDKVMNVVVVGGIHHNTLGVIRSLGEEKKANMEIYVILVGSILKKRNFVSESKYIKKNRCYLVKEDADIIEVLQELKTAFSKAVLICCSDGSSETIIKNKNVLEDTYYCPSSVYDISKLMEKQIQAQIAVDSGFCVPICENVTLETVGAWEEYPCITKPGKSILGKGKADICICRDVYELKQYLKGTSSGEVQVQKFIDKKMEYQLIGCSLGAGEKVIIPGFTNIIRQPFNTNTGYLRYSPIQQLNYNQTAVISFIKKIGYSGLFSLEFIRDEDDIDYFLEINLRNDGNAYCVKSAGVNLPYVWVVHNYYGQLPQNIKLEIEESIYFMPELQDAKIGIKKIGVFKWIKEFLGAKSHAIINSKDPYPFIYKLFSYIKKGLQEYKR